MKNSGFSLVELLIVVALLGILLAIVGLSAKTAMDKYRVEKQMKEMLADLLNARVGAMSKNRVHFVNLSATQYSVYEDTNPGPDGDGDLQTTSPSDTQILLKNLEPAYAICKIKSDGTCVTSLDRIDLDTRGLVVAGMQTFRVTTPLGAGSDCIVISATRIKIGVSNGSANCVEQ